MAELLCKTQRKYTDHRYISMFEHFQQVNTFSYLNCGKQSENGSHDRVVNICDIPVYI